ncbi:MAG: two component transcriptional regulator, LuxR family, partial [Verrucomicrobiaceae bacterium]|nr:two component transcriptional regulator, LuxR family [Verrucomicrobiaceae bacterium]
MPSTTNPSTSSDRKRVLIVDDHPVFRRGIAALIEEQQDLSACGEAENAISALEAMRQLSPDVILMDINMPGTNGIELIKMALAEQPKLVILVLSMHSESLYALRALRAGAKGYVMKAEALESVVTALRKVLNGGIYVSPRFTERLIFKAIQSEADGTGSPVDKLSDRELEVLQLMGRGFGTRDSATALNLSIKT